MESNSVLFHQKEVLGRDLFFLPLVGTDKQLTGSGPRVLWLWVRARPLRCSPDRYTSKMGKLAQSFKTGTGTLTLGSCWSELVISAILSMVALIGVPSTLGLQQCTVRSHLFFVGLRTV